MKRSQRGSALVFVLIIIAGIVTVTVGTQRLSLVQFNQATREEDNTYALYAAKAGLEDGLLRFRHERDVETTDGRVHRFDVTKSVSVGEIGDSTAINATPGYAASSQYYDLAINFKTNQIGDLANMGQSPQMLQDEEIQLTGFPNDGNDYYLRYAFRWVDGAGCRAKDGGKGAFVQIQQVSTPTTGSSSLSQTVVKIPATGSPATYQSNVNQANILLKNSASLTSVIRVRAYHCPVLFAFTTATTRGGNGGGPEFDSLETKIKATGYFGTAKRTLEATVDRKSGRLISVYDFNIYSGQGCVSSTLNLSDCAP